jgi:two-component system LytT family response regulator
MNTLPYDSNFIIIEDNPEAASLLKQMLIELSFNNINVCMDGRKGIEALNFRKYDVLFLDIDLMGQYNGIDVLKYIEISKIHVHVIIVTGFIAYSKDVIKYSIIDLLLKPINAKELKLSLEKVAYHKSIHKRESKKGKNGRNSVIIKINGNNEIHYFRPKNVAYIEADGSYTHIVMTNGSKEVVSQNLGKIVLKFPGDQFKRISRKFVVNINYVKKFNKKSKELVLDVNDTVFKLKGSHSYLVNDFL